MVEIDGSAGEGGGQILRSCLALSLATGRPFRIRKIRANREKPGLLRQHLTAVEAAAEIGAAEVTGVAIGSAELSFAPSGVRPGSYRFAVGTAGSTTLVLQAVLPALALAGGPSEIVLEGGTHNPFAPPFDFLDKAFLPLIRRMGPLVEATLDRPGFYPAGGGRFEVRVEPVAKLVRLDLPERGEIKRRLARALVAGLPASIGHREVKAVRDLLSWDRDSLAVEEVRGSPGMGNILCLEVESEHVTEVFTGFGQRGVAAEEVARGAVEELKIYLASGAPVGVHLADQLLLPMALAGGGSFRTQAPTRHTLTNIEVLKMFLDVEIEAREVERELWSIEVKRGA